MPLRRLVAGEVVTLSADIMGAERIEIMALHPHLPVRCAMISELEVFRSFRRFDCDETAFVLTAVGIPSHVHFDGIQYVLAVPEPQYVAAAVAHLARYAAESRSAPPSLPPLNLHPFVTALAGAVLYALALLLVGYAASNGLWRLDAFELGAIDSGRVQAGEWWRAWTALTLHRDFVHLAGNLSAGMWLGYLAGRHLGPGNAWLLTVVGSGIANLLESLLGPATHHSVGASTAVFTLLGLMAAYTWRIRYELPQRWALRWGPLVAGALILGLMGSGGLSGMDPPDVVAASTTDIVAHASGFLTGTVLGAVAAVGVVRKQLLKLPQWATGLAAIAIVASAWAVALNS